MQYRRKARYLTRHPVLRMHTWLQERLGLNLITVRKVWTLLSTWRDELDDAGATVALGREIAWPLRFRSSCVGTAAATQPSPRLRARVRRTSEPARLTRRAAASCDNPRVSCPSTARIRSPGPIVGCGGDSISSSPNQRAWEAPPPGVTDFT